MKAPRGSFGVRALRAWCGRSCHITKKKDMIIRMIRWQEGWPRRQHVSTCAPTTARLRGSAKGHQTHARSVHALLVRQQNQSLYEELSEVRRNYEFVSQLHYAKATRTDGRTEETEEDDSDDGTRRDGTDERQRQDGRRGGRTGRTDGLRKTTPMTGRPMRGMQTSCSRSRQTRPDPRPTSPPS